MKCMEVFYGFITLIYASGMQNKWVARKEKRCVAMHTQGLKVQLKTCEFNQRCH